MEGSSWERLKCVPWSSRDTCEHREWYLLVWSFWLEFLKAEFLLKHLTYFSIEGILINIFNNKDLDHPNSYFLLFLKSSKEKYNKGLQWLKAGSDIFGLSR